jgi:uncharacterized protein
MTPQERQLVDDLFDRLAKLESAPRDPDASSAIAQGLRSAPNAVYALVQTVLLQDEALKRANHRIQELEQATQSSGQSQSGGFLDSMRDSVLGKESRGSVPNVPPPQSRPVWNSGQVMQQIPHGQYQEPNSHEPYGQGAYGQGAYGQGAYGQGPSGQGPLGQGPQGQGGFGQSYGAPPFGGGGGSFLGTAAATAAGFVGGSLLLNSIRSMMGGGGSHQAFADTSESRASSPWSDQSNSQLARDAGVGDVGLGNDRADDNSRAGLFDQASMDDNDRDDMDFDSNDSGGDDDFGGGDDSDYA